MMALEKSCRRIGALAGVNLSFSEWIRLMMLEIRQLVPCDSINMGTVDLHSEEGFHFALDGFLMSPERRELLPLFKHQNPMLEHARRTGLNTPLRFIDFQPRRVFEETAIFRECYRGYTHSMITFGVAALDGLNVSFVLSRASGEFSDKEKFYLSVLQPLISAMVRERMLRDALNIERATGVSAGLVHGSGPYIHTMNDRAMYLFRKHFPHGSRHVLPPPVWDNLSNQLNQVIVLLELPMQGRLCAHMAPDKEHWKLEIWEQAGEIEPAVLARFGLSPRQQEVVHWMACGKSTAEIAMILGISPRTVQKHLESIFRQIGAENRLAALHILRHQRID